MRLNTCPIEIRDHSSNVICLINASPWRASSSLSFIWIGNFPLFTVVSLHHYLKPWCHVHYLRLIARSHIYWIISWGTRARVYAWVTALKSGFWGLSLIRNVSTSSWTLFDRCSIWEHLFTLIVLWWDLGTNWVSLNELRSSSLSSHHLVRPSLSI